MGIVSKRIHGWHLFKAFAEVIAATCLFFVMLGIRRHMSGLVEHFYTEYLILVIGTIVIDNVHQIREHRLISATTMMGDWKTAIRRTVLVAFIWFGFLAARQDVSVSRLFLFIYLLHLCPCLFLAHIGARKFLAPRVFGRHHRFGVILLGKPEGCEGLIRWLSSQKTIGINLLGYLDDQMSAEAAELPRLGSTQDLNHVLEITRARLVVAMGLPTDDDAAVRLRDACDSKGCRLAFQCRLGGDLRSRVALCQTEGVTLLSIRSEPLQCPINRVFKRSLDLMIAIPMVIFVLPPLALIVWLVHRVSSPGPLLFRQLRGGLGGQAFTLLKFRTMYCQNNDDARQAVLRDDRIFKGGAWLRKSSVDEFPQFLNVLAGSMSVVGPRPHLEVHDLAFSKVSPEYRIRANIKPGITGLAQVQGHRGPTPEAANITARVRADLEYMENWTLSTDIVLVLRTAAHLFRSPNAV
jgi:exopolysaccharide biosynthesis polyprenyl glycosylphosphotransferase